MLNTVHAVIAALEVDWIVIDTSMAAAGCEMAVYPLLMPTKYNEGITGGQLAPHLYVYIDG